MNELIEAEKGEVCIGQGRNGLDSLQSGLKCELARCRAKEPDACIYTKLVHRTSQLVTP